jgi:hypothetical protein
MCKRRKAGSTPVTVAAFGCEERGVARPAANIDNMRTLRRSRPLDDRDRSWEEAHAEMLVVFETPIHRRNLLAPATPARAVLGRIGDSIQHGSKLVARL